MCSVVMCTTYSSYVSGEIVKHRIRSHSRIYILMRTFMALEKKMHGGKIRLLCVYHFHNSDRNLSWCWTLLSLVVQL